MYTWIYFTYPLSAHEVMIASPAVLSLSIIAPVSTSYSSGSVPVRLSASVANGSLDTVWYNVLNGSTWVYPSNVTYVDPTSMTGFVNGGYVFYAWANATDGTTVQKDLDFTVSISSPVWGQWWFWGILGLVLVEAFSGTFAVRYRRRVVEQTKVIEAYSPFVIAEALFKADIERRGLKIKEFEQKYGVSIRPRSTLEDVIRSLEAAEKEEKS
jgi:hypothetical protein